MSNSRFVPSTGALIGVSAAIVLLAAVLFATGSFDLLVGDSRAAIRVVRAVLLLAATFCLFTSVLLILKYRRDPDSIDLRWILWLTTGALVCLVAAWILAAVLRS